jgi:phosphate transport system protein
MRIIESDLNRLRDKILEMGSRTESAIESAMRAVLERNTTLSEQVIVNDAEIDKLENESDKLAIEIVALRKPVANDLRLTVTVLHTAPTIERIADHAVNIAKRARVLNKEPQLEPFIDLHKLSEIAQQMLHDSLQSLISGDVELARKTIKNDSKVDDLYHSIHAEIVEMMQRDSSTVKRGLELSFIIKHLERIADYATNICEMVIYMIEGRIIRHTEEAA